MLDIKAVVQDVSARDAAMRYGIPINRSGKAHCIHGNSDSSPSMHFFPDGHCYCFCCNRQVDSIDIVRGLFGGNVTDAAGRLCQDFGLPYRDYQVGGTTKVKREKYSWEIKDELKAKLKELYRQKATIEGLFAESGATEPSDMWLDKMHILVAKIGALEEELNNLYYENAD